MTTSVHVGNFDRLETTRAPVVVGLQNERSQEENLTRLGIYRTGGKIRLGVSHRGKANRKKR